MHMLALKTLSMHVIAVLCGDYYQRTQEFSFSKEQFTLRINLQISIVSHPLLLLSSFSAEKPANSICCIREHF